MTGCTVGAAATCHSLHGRLFPEQPDNHHRLPQHHSPTSIDSDNGVGKIDYHINDKNTFNGVLVIGNTLGIGEDRGFINPIFSNGYRHQRLDDLRHLGLHPQLPMVNEVRFGYNRMTFTHDQRRRPAVKGSGQHGLDCARVADRSKSVASLSCGTWHNRPQAIAPNPYWDAQDSLSYLVGKHSSQVRRRVRAHRGRFQHPGLLAAARSISPTSQPFSQGITEWWKALVGNPTRQMLVRTPRDSLRMTGAFPRNLRSIWACATNTFRRIREDQQPLGQLRSELTDWTGSAGHAGR